MTANRTSAQIAAGTGSPLELIQLPGGSSIYVPSAVVRGIRESDGEIGDIKVTDNSELAVQAVHRNPTNSTGNLNSTNAAVSVPCSGLSSASAHFITAMVGTVAFEVTPDPAGLVNWSILGVTRIDAGNGTATNGQIGNPSAGAMYEAGLPASAMWFRVRVVAYTSGTGTVSVGSSSAAVEPSVALVGPLPAGTNTLGTVTLASTTVVVGAVRRGTLWYDESSALLTANQVLTGGSRDVMSVANTSAGNSYGEVFGAKGIYDQAHTLYVEESKAGTIWLRTAKFSAVQVETGGLWVSEINLRPAMRYYRAIVVMGPAAATTTASLTTKTI